MKNSELFLIFQDQSFDPMQPVTDFEIIVACSDYPTNFEKGAMIITRLSSSVLSSADKDLSQPYQDGDDFFVDQVSKIRFDLQIDFYRAYRGGEDGSFVMDEAVRVREWLKGYQVQEYLSGIGCEILPCYSQIRSFVEWMDNKKMITRCVFDFSLVKNDVLQQRVGVFDKIRNEIIFLKG